MPTVAAGRFEVVRKLGQGAFSRVYEAYDTMGKRPCALKVDQSGSKLKEPLVDYESRVMHELQGIVGVPDLLWTGDITPPNRTQPLRCMALELLGADLEEHRKNSQLSLKNAACLGYVILNVLKEIHTRGFLHRDLKPSNIMLAPNDGGGGPRDRRRHAELFVVDFGLAKRFLNADGSHIAMRRKNGVTGTPRYCSYRTHLGRESSRRDDLESLMYVVISLARPLPWEGRRKNREIGDIKQRTPEAEVVPESRYLQAALAYCKALGFDETPDYAHVGKLLKRAYKELA